MKGRINMKQSKPLGLDADGIQKTMYRKDYVADMLGQFALGVMGNIVGQLSYFYTDKVGVAVGSVGIALGAAKVVDAFTDVIVGNMIDHSKGGNEKYYKWLLRMIVPAATILILLFTVPIQAGQIPAMLYILVTNVLLTAIILTIMTTPFSAIQIVRTKSQQERNSIGVLRAVGSYASGMFIVIATIPVTNALGGTQSAWIKYGAIIALVVVLCLVICYRNGKKVTFAQGVEAELKQEEENVPFRDAIRYLFRNKYWVIVLVFNLLTNITNTISGSATAYYTKWIFGNDNLVALLGGLAFGGTIIGFLISQPLINKVGIRKTVYIGSIGYAVTAAIRCLAPDNLVVYAVTSILGSVVQLPLMCIYGVILGMSVDYNEYKYDKKMVATAAGAIGFGNKVGVGIGTALLSLFLFLGHYDATLAAATSSMKMAIYGFANYLPIVINLLLFFSFMGFDIEAKLPQMKAEVEARRKNEGKE